MEALIEAVRIAEQLNLACEIDQEWLDVPGYGCNGCGHD